MMKCDLTASFVNLILDYSPETGIFIWDHREDVSPSWNAKHSGKEAGCKTQNGYITIGINGTDYYAHRLAWLIMTGAWPTHEIDHIDMNVANNRWSNLRKATHSQNSCNRKMQKNNRSGYKGVFFNKQKGKYQAKICINSKRKHIGFFKTAQAASIAYKIASKRLHQQFART